MSVFWKISQKSKRRISVGCTAFLAVGILSATTACGPKTSNAPVMKAQAVGQKSTVQISGDGEQNLSALFQTELKQRPQNVIRTVPGGKLQISFSGGTPEQVAVTGSLLATDGSAQGEEKKLTLVHSSNTYTFSITPMSGVTVKNSALYGFCVTASLSGKDYRYPLLVRTDPSLAASSEISEETQKIQVADYSLSVPLSWKVQTNPDLASVSFQKDGKKIGLATRLRYDPTKPVSQFVAEDWKTVSSKNLENMSSPATELLIRKDNSDSSSSSALSSSAVSSQPSSGQASSDSSGSEPGDELHIFVLSDSTRYAYDLSFDPSLIEEKDVEKIAATLDLLGYETIEKVSEKLKDAHPEIAITNEFVSEDFGTAALFGSLKSDPTQGVALLIDFPADAQNKAKGKTILTPEKRGPVRAVAGTSAKTSIVTVKAQDGYEWVFDIYNGFLQESPSSSSQTSGTSSLAGSSSVSSK